MEFPKFTADLSIISKLGDNPGTDDGLSADELKGKFDEAGLLLQAYLNGTLVELLNSVFAGGDSKPSNGLNMTGAINMNRNALQNLRDPEEQLDAMNLRYADLHYAPNGYGLGAAQCRQVNSVEEITQNGYYRVWLETAKGDPITGMATFHAVVDGAYNNVHLSGKLDGGYIHRDKWDGTWGEWTWVNPPMRPGVSYRTTKRYKNKPVYCALLETGSIAANSGGTINIDGFGATEIVSQYIKDKHDFNDKLVHFYGFPSGNIAYDASTSVVYLANNYSTAWSGTCMLEFVK